jgi:hypothetical protein
LSLALIDDVDMLINVRVMSAREEMMSGTRVRFVALL